MATVTITDDNFKSEVLGSTKPVLLDFWAEWCGPCKAMAPALEELSEDVGDKYVIAKVNIEEAQDTAVDFHVRGVPTLMIIKDGDVVATHTGAMTKSKLSEWLTDNT